MSRKFKESVKQAEFHQPAWNDHRSESLPGDGENVGGQALRLGTPADDVPRPGFPGMIGQEATDMSGIAGGRPLGPFYFDGNQFARVFDDVVDFRTVSGSLEPEPAPAQISEAVPQFDSDPLLEQRPWIGQDRVQGFRGQDIDLRKANDLAGVPGIAFRFSIG